MRSSASRRVFAAVLLIVLGTQEIRMPSGVRAQTTLECFDPNEPTPEPYGPTDISAVTGNRSLSAALNSDGTVTVLKWPSPSYYDQIKYRTSDRSLERLGALPNEGALMGLAWREGSDEWEFDWLREWRSKQRYADDDGDEVVTVFTKPAVGLTAILRDVVAADADVLIRELTLRRSRSSEVEVARVFAFANFNPVYSKTVQAPFQDWCTEERNDEGAEYRDGADAIVHARSGFDESTGTSSGAALALGFVGESDGHQVGGDTYESPGPGTSAYDDAADGQLSDSNTATGQADAALMESLRFGRGHQVASTVIVAAASSSNEAVGVLTTMRRRSAAAVRAAKKRWWAEWLEPARLPKDAPGIVVDLAKRALISIRQGADKRGLMVASVATQPPYGLDWIRNGAYINHALEIAGHPEMVEAHNSFYARLQATVTDRPRGGEATPAGNWSQNFYADGVVGGPIPYEVDATGLGIWTLWDHYRQVGGDTGAGSCSENPGSAPCRYLLGVYEEIQRAAQYLTDCRDLSTGLQCPAHEEGGTTPSQTLAGAQAVWLGLDSAARAALVRGTVISLANAERWEQRRDEISAAIDAQMFNEECNCYTTDYEIGGALLWPVGYLNYGSPRSDSQAATNWDGIADAIGGEAPRGGQESRALLGNAYAWSSQPGKLLLVKKGLEWVARVSTTNETGLLGEAWMVYPPQKGSVTTMSAQPNVWSQSIFYLAALKAYGSTRYRFH